MTTYINLFGGPGVGKSTLATGLFSQMKRSGKSVELVTEVAKDLVWEERSKTLSFQPYVTVKQMRNLFRVQGKVDYVITDAPILLGIMYGRNFWENVPSSYEQFILDMHKQVFKPSVNILLKRNHEYDPIGRIQTEEGAKKLDEELKFILKEFDISYLNMTNDQVYDSFK